jgi:hypothetical protein
MRVSEVLHIQFPQAGFVSVDTDLDTQSGTAHSRNRCTACKTDKDLCTKNLFYETIF